MEYKKRKEKRNIRREGGREGSGKAETVRKREEVLFLCSQRQRCSLFSHLFHTSVSAGPYRTCLPDRSRTLSPNHENKINE